jgi:HEAT repeat protein
MASMRFSASFLAALGSLLLLAGCARCLAGAPSAARAPAAGSEVSLLAHPDFVTRSRAAERWVARGEEALPALGAASDLRVGSLGREPSLAVEPVVRAILDGLSEERARAHLESPWPVVRRIAAEDAGHRGRWAAVPPLVARLEDRDGEVREAAAVSLRRLTNLFIPYRADAAPAVRARAAAAWREWWNSVGRIEAADRDRAGSS